MDASYLMRPQNEPMKTAAVILAAGASTRFGSPKQLARIGSRTLVETSSKRRPRLGPSSPIVVARVDAAHPESRSWSSTMRRIRPEPLAPPGSRGPPEPKRRRSSSSRISRRCRSSTFARRWPAGWRHADRRRRLGRAARSARADPTRRLCPGGRHLRRHRAADLLADRPELVKRVESARMRRMSTRPRTSSGWANRCPGCRELYLPVEVADGCIPTSAHRRRAGRRSARSSPESSATSRSASSIAIPSTSTPFSIPGTDARRERQSVAVHLVGLCHWLEHGLDRG